MGGGFACGVSVDSRLHCWGSAGFAQLGRGARQFTAILAPQEIIGLTNATQVTAGEMHACALVLGGRAMCWGDNVSGQVGTARAVETAPV